MINVMEINGYLAQIQYDPQLDILCGAFIDFDEDSDFYAQDVESLRHQGANRLYHLLHPTLPIVPGAPELLVGRYEQAQSLAAIEERQRLAQNLHDTVNQSLFSASMIAEVLPRLWERKPEEGREALQDLRRLIRGALAEMRGLLAELRPVVLTDTELSDLLQQLGDALTGRANVPVKVQVTGVDILPTEVRIVFYRLGQEAMNNIAKHAHATAVDIHLRYENDTAELRIHDNGRGFDPETIPTGHYGLSMMRERAQAVGATVVINSQPGEGTEILIGWTIPTPPTEQIT